MLGLFSLPLGLAQANTHLNWLVFGLLAAGFAGLVAAIILVVQRWASARQALVQRVAELTTIEQIGRAIVQAELDVDELSDLMYNYASQVADATIFHLGLFDGDDYTLRRWIREGQRLPEQTFRLEPGVGLVMPTFLVGQMRETGQPLLVRDFRSAREMDTLPARPAYVSEDSPRSALYVPLIAGETVIGTMSIQSFRPNAYGDEELRVLSAMANQAAVAMQKAQLYAREKKRARQLETIGQVGRQVSALCAPLPPATLELDELFERIVHLIRENFGYYHVGIFTADHARERIAFQASASAGDHDVKFDVAWGEGLIGWVAAHGQAVIVNDVQEDTRYRCVDALEEAQSELCVPLIMATAPQAPQARLVGILDVQSDEPDAFGQDDLFILETLGTQVAIAIQTAHLYDAERQQAWLSTALLQVADSMSQISDVDAVLTSIVRLTPILAGVDRCALLLWNPATEAFAPVQTYGLAPELRETFERMVFPRGTVLALDLIHLDKSPLLLTPDEDGRPTKLIPRALAETFDIREMVLLPLLAQGELLGVLMVDYAGRPHHFDEMIISMLTGIANQAAMVLQTARLVQAQQEEAYVSIALLQVAEAVSRSTHLADTLSTIVRITPILVGVEMCAILLWSETHGAFVPFQQYGLKHQDADDFWALRLPDSDPLVRLLHQGQARQPSGVVVGDLSEPSLITSVLGREAMLALPLVTKGEIVGLMVVDYAGSASRFTQRWINILAGIAGQAAIAVENDRLLQEAAEQQRLKQELEVAQRIQASFVPERCPDFPGWELAATWRSARQVGGDFYDFIPLPCAPGQPQPPPLPGRMPQMKQSVPETGDGPGRMGLIVADVADKGVPAALFMALSRTLVRTMAIDGRAPASAIARANDLIIADARSDLFVTLFYVILQPQAGEVVYVNAGHMPPLVVRAGDGTTQELRAPGIALGVLPSFEFEERRVRLEPGDVLVLYTDGVTEASNADQDMFGRDRLAQTVSAHRQRSASDLVQIVNQAVADFVGDAPQFDDFTLLVAKRSA